MIVGYLFTFEIFSNHIITNIQQRCSECKNWFHSTSTEICLQYTGNRILLFSIIQRTDIY